jgi:AsmA protein
MFLTLKRILFALVAVAGLLVLVASAVLLFVDVNRYKPQLEAAASATLGMDVRLRGRIGVAFFPSLHVTVGDGQVLGEQGATVASAKRAVLWVDWLPLLRREFRLNRVELTQPWLFIERDSEGRINLEGLKVATLIDALDGAHLSFLDGTLLYIDRRSGESVEAVRSDLVSRIQLRRARSPELLKDISLEAELTCGEVRTKDLSVSALRISVHGHGGVFHLEPATMRLFGGQASGALRADFSGAVPLYQLRCSLPRFRIEEFLKTLSPKRAAEGPMDFSASLSMQGNTRSQLVQTAAGEMSLQGKHLALIGTDLDRAISRFEASQSFNLVDVGAVFLAGPIGLTVTRGYGFASLFRGSGGNSSIETLVSDWKVVHGVARARDVAMATSKSRIALQGGLDFVHQRFADVAVAAVDAKGCAIVRQEIHGPFGNPSVEKPRLLTSLAGPALKLYRRTRGLFPAGPCEAFYSGSVTPPE